MKSKSKYQVPDSMYKHSDNWKGIFYVNSKDPRIIVPKSNPSMGWTLNFGHPSTYVGFVLILLIIIAASIWL